VRVDERHYLVAQVAVVAPGTRGVDELAAAIGRPGVYEDQERRRDVASGEDGVRSLREWLAERIAVAPHRQMPGVPLDHIDAWVPLLRSVIAWRDIDPQRAACRIS
jgi:hypothetical protein